MFIEEATLEVLVERILPDFDSKALVTWAVKILDSGEESENLLILAGLDYEATDEREKYFQKSLADLNLSLGQSEETLIEDYATLIAKKAVSGKIDVDFAFKQMAKIVSATAYDLRYIAFYEIDEDLGLLHYGESVLFNPELTLQNYQDFILEEFKIFLEMERLNIPLKERNYNYCISCSKLVKPMLKTKYQLREPRQYQAWCCPDCESEELRFSSEHAVKWMIIERYNTKESKSTH